MIARTSRSPEETAAMGERLGEAARAGDVFLLDGPFGAGKTQLVQGLARGLGVDSPVTSPSFILAQEHQGRVPLYHLDLFRLEALDEVTLETLEEYVGGDGVCAVEWPALLPAAWRADATVITLRVVDETTRELEIEAGAARLAEALSGVARA